MDDDPKPTGDVELDDKLAWIDRQRPPHWKPPHSGPCDWQDVPVAKKSIRAKPDEKGQYFRRECRICKRFYGFGVR